MAQHAAPLLFLIMSRQRPLLRRILGRDRKIAFVSIAPIVILMTLFIAWPFIKALYTSMTIRNLATREKPSLCPDNYARLLRRSLLSSSCPRHGLLHAGRQFRPSCSLACAALLLHNQKRFRNVLTALVLLPWIVSLQ